VISWKETLAYEHLPACGIMLMYIVTAARYAMAGNRYGALYWLSALCITATVTFVHKP
jgi:hypothetical protein